MAETNMSPTLGQERPSLPMQAAPVEAVAHQIAQPTTQIAESTMAGPTSQGQQQLTQQNNDQDATRRTRLMALARVTRTRRSPRLTSIDQSSEDEPTTTDEPPTNRPSTPLQNDEMTNEPSMQACPLCFEDEDADMIKCVSCKKKTHYKCCFIEPESAKNVLKYYCKECRQKKKLNITWKLTIANSTKKAEKRKLYYPVEKILDVRYKDNNTREFLIKWKGWSAVESTWEEEHHLDGCLPVLQKFCELKQIRYSRIEGFVGATPSSSLNEKNWVKPTSIKNAILGFKKNPTTLNVEVWDSLRKQDSLYIVPFEGHCYVVLHYVDTNFGYIADGSNLYLEDKEVQKDLSDEMNIILIPRKFNQQHAVDHCGSSAVVIGIEMIEHYRMNIKPDTITAEPRLYKRIKNFFHPEASNPIEHRNPSEFQTPLICEVCGKRFAKGKQKNYKCHIARHGIKQEK